MTDFEKRIAAITGKRASLDDADAKKKQEQENRTQDLIGEIISMGDRIKAVIEIGKHLQRNHLLPVEGWNSYDKSLEKYGYDGAMRAEGIYHHVGFMARYSRVWNDDGKPVCYLGIENGGAKVMEAVEKLEDEAMAHLHRMYKVLCGIVADTAKEV